MNRLLCMLLASVLQITAVVAATYRLDVEVTPHGSGSLNTEGGTFEEGSSVYLQTYINSGYVFLGWYEGDELLSSATRFNYTIPSHDAIVQARYEFNPGVPGNPAMPDTVNYYCLTASVAPHGAGSLNISDGKYSGGTDVSMRTYGNTGYRFLGWVDEQDTILSSSTSFTYTMPYRDSHITAKYEFDPSVPAGPDSIATKYTVHVKCKPTGGGYFNIDSYTATEGSIVRIYSYINNGYKFIRWENEEGVEIGADRDLYYEIPHGESTVYGIFEFDPSVPQNPNKNAWNENTGQVIVDDFTPGNLYNTIYDLVGYRNLGDITSVIVKGLVTRYDLQDMSSSYLSSLVDLDLSRVGGLSEIPSYAFEYSSVNSISLPGCISSMGDYVFYGCENLSSISVYSMVPPQANDYTFRNFDNKENCVVRVPSQAIALYESAAYWSDFSILPLAEELHSLSVSLPEYCIDGRYKNNRIELVNVASGSRQKYVVTDRLVYTFIGLQKNEEFNIYLFSQTGLEIGRIEGVLFEDKDINVTFETLKPLKKVKVRVNSPDGANETQNVDTEWFEPKTDGSMIYLRKAESLGEVPVGQPLLCRITLPKNLGSEYYNPTDTTFVVSENASDLVINLQPLRQITLEGKVIDEDGIAINGANISINSMLNGKYSVTVTTKSDQQGKWKVNVLDAPEYRLTYGANECINVVDTVSVDKATDLVAIDPVTLRSIATTRISYDFTFTSASKSEDEAELQTYYSDYKNVNLRVYNASQGRAHTNLSIQYPTLVILDENVKPGDKLLITAESTTKVFADVVREVTIDENQRGKVTFDILGKGGIEARFAMTENPAVSAMLYNSKGNLMSMSDYSEAKVRFNDLDNGEYTLITIGKSALLNGVQRISSLSDVGLTEGTDYVLNKVVVEDGTIAEITNDLVPPFDENRFRYTTSNSSVSVNKSTLVPGNYLTIKSTVDFKTMYKSQVSDIIMIYDLPDNCEIVSGSMMCGNQVIPYDIENNRVFVRLGNVGYNAQVRFVVIPTSGGNLSPSASVSFQIDDNTIVQPVGTATCQVKDLEIVVPHIVAGTKVAVSGLAPLKSKIDIYDEGTLIGSTTALANGLWNCVCELIEPYNLSTHQIYAEVTTSEGVVLKSQSMPCCYDKNAIEITKVTMYHPNPEMKTTFESVFDFQNPKNTPTHWTVYYPNKQFTYTVEFTNNSPEVITNVVLYVLTAGGKWLPYRCLYDENKDLWIVSFNLGNRNDDNYPVNCSVDFEYNAEALVDAVEQKESLDNILAFHDGIKEEGDNITNRLMSLFDNIENENSAEFYEDYDEILRLLELTKIDGFEDIVFKSDEEFNNFCDNYNNVFSSELFNNLSTQDFLDLQAVSEQLQFVEIQEIGEIDKHQLLDEDFDEFVLTNGATIYVKLTDNEYVYINPAEHIRYCVKIDDELLGTLNLYAPGKDVVLRIKAVCNKIESKFQWIDKKWEEVLEKVSKFFEFLDLVDPAFTATHGIAKNNFGSNMNAIKELQAKGRSNWSAVDVYRYNRLKSNALSSGKLMTSARKASNTFKNAWSGALSKGIGVISMLNDLRSGVKELNQMCDIYLSLPDECPDDETKWQLAIADCASTAASLISYWENKLVLDVALMTDLLTSAVALIPSMGASMVPLAAGVAGLAIDKGIDIIHNKTTNWTFNRLKSEIKSLRCNKNCGEPGMPQCPDDGDNNGDGGDGGQNHSGSPNDGVEIDPSGFVYEAVPTCRIEGVQASIYYKETVEDMYGDLSENVVLWNAEEYAQKNPLFTDENGMYRWDVPQGLWQVKFEKDGYLPTESEWLPVPPPQLEVNIAMSQNKQPEVVEAHAYENGIQVQFDKYMDPTTVNEQTMRLIVADNVVEGEIVTLDDEVADPFASSDNVDALRYARVFRFIPTEPLSMSQGEIRLNISREVKSYAGIPMQSNFSQVFDIEKEITEITVDDPIQVLYGGEKTITVDVVPFDASVGKVLRISNSSPSLLTVDRDEVEIDENGQAQVKIKGELPGQTMLKFSVDGSYITGEAQINIVTELYDVDKPVASRASGTQVYRGTKIALTSETPNSNIYYTIDGSCPCDADGTRMKYILPIEVNDDIEIKAIVVTSNNEESELAEFRYTLKKSDIDYTLANGWSWISHNLESTIMPDEFSAIESVDRIVGQTAELVRDPNLGMVGNLKSMAAESSYKIHTSSSTESLRLSNIARNPSLPISIGKGWNWIGYTPGQTMTVAEAFEPTNVTEGDFIVGQRGFAQYNGLAWEGTLYNLMPGAGYLYFSNDDKQIVYNTAIVSQAASQNVRLFASASPWTVDVYKFPQIMCMVVTLVDENGNAPDINNCHFGAFCGSECRGIGKLVNDKLMLSVYGNTGDVIDFKAISSDGSETLIVKENLTFAETLIGSVNNPHTMVVNNVQNSITSAIGEGTVNVKAHNGKLYLNGDISNISSLSIINFDGRKVMDTDNLGNGEVSVGMLPTGAYVVVIVCNGEYSYHKLIIK